MPRASLRSVTDSGSLAAGPDAEVVEIVSKFGEAPDPDVGGDPMPAAQTFTNEPQFTLPGSAGGVTTEMRCSRRGRADSGLLGAESLAPLNGRAWARSGLRAWRGSSG